MKPHRMNCPNCNIEAETFDVSFPDRYTVRIDGMCLKCKSKLFMETPLDKVLPNDDFDLENWDPKGRVN